MSANDTGVKLDERNRLIINGWKIVNLQSFRLCIDDDHMLKAEVIDSNSENYCFDDIFSQYRIIYTAVSSENYENCKSRLLNAADDEIFKYFSDNQKNDPAPVTGNFAPDSLKKEILESLSRFEAFNFLKELRAKLIILSIIFGKVPEKWLSDYKEMFGKTTLSADSSDDYQISPDAYGEMYMKVISPRGNGITLRFGGKSRRIITDTPLLASFAGDKIKFIKKAAAYKKDANRQADGDALPDDFASDGAGGNHKIYNGILTVNELGIGEKTYSPDFIAVFSAQFAYLAVRKNGGFITNLEADDTQKISSVFSDENNIFVRFEDGTFFSSDESIPDISEETFIDKMLDACEQ